jgi:hypothetical protein
MPRLAKKLAPSRRLKTLLGTSMPSLPENPRAIRGDNLPPDYAKDVTERMAQDYAALMETVTLQLQEARGLPATVESEEDLLTFSDLVVRLRDTANRAEGARVAEKEPYLRAGQAVDGFFGSLKERAQKGLAVLSGRVNDYQLQKLAAERLKREREKAKAEAAERARREEAERAMREAEAAERVAERARRDQEAKLERALDKAAASDVAQIDARMATELADAARLAAAQSPAAMARSRFESGRLATMKQVGYAEVIDRTKLDAAALFPFISDSQVLIALRKWAQARDFREQMPGAAIGFKDSTVIR